jgi:hypothetical protein
MARMLVRFLVRFDIQNPSYLPALARWHGGTIPPMPPLEKKHFLLPPAHPRLSELSSVFCPLSSALHKVVRMLVRFLVRLSIQNLSYLPALARWHGGTIPPMPPLEKKHFPLPPAHPEPSDLSSVLWLLSSVFCLLSSLWSPPPLLSPNFTFFRLLTPTTAYYHFLHFAPNCY